MGNQANHKSVSEAVMLYSLPPKKFEYSAQHSRFSGDCITETFDEKAIVNDR